MLVCYCLQPVTVALWDEGYCHILLIQLVGVQRSNKGCPLATYCIAHPASDVCRFWTAPHMLVAPCQTTSPARPMLWRSPSHSASSQLLRQLHPQLPHPLACKALGPMQPSVGFSFLTRSHSRWHSNQDQRVAVRARKALHSCQLCPPAWPPPLSSRGLPPMGVPPGGVLT